MRARPLLERRGPDSLKSWKSRDGRSELLHARLAIVDPGGMAHQPLSDPDTGTTLAFNGEIYNYPELRAELPDYPYRTSSDTEVILAAYRRWGIQGLSRLRGMFALALADGATGHMYLARDPIGKKPLFVANWDGSTLFGSSAAALVAASGRVGAIDSASVADYWADGHVSPTRSIFAGCRPVAPGEVVEIRPNGTSRSFHVAPSSAGENQRTRDPDELAELLRISVRRRLRNNPQPVSLLSGGIDSTVVTTAIHRESSVQVLTLGALIPFTLDERYARYAARKLGLSLEIVPAGVGRIEDGLDFSMNLQDEPLGMMSFFPLALLLRAMKPYGRILFSGDGGDEVFLGYGQPSDWTARSGDAAKVNGLQCGPELPSWMSAWGRQTVTRVLVGHMFTKLDRASAEQGIEMRCPLLDWDVMAFARTLEPSVLFGADRPKHLLKDQLREWPSWFVDRPKVGFAYHLRWAWALRGYSGLRDRIEAEAVETFRPSLAGCLQRPVSEWSGRDIWGHFPQVWKLLAWSAFLRRQREMARPRVLEAVAQ